MASSHMKSESTAKPSYVPVIIALVIGLVLGILGGHLLLGRYIDQLLGGGAPAQVALSESDLDKTMATYIASGTAGKVTYRDAILENGSLEAALNEDGSYRIPSADSALAVARSRVLTAEAEKLGIVVGDAEVNAYAQAAFGTTDLDTIATAYGMNRDAASVLLKDAAVMSALRNQALSEQAGEAPQAPAEPGEGEEVTMLPDYAAYIIGLAGSEWDANTGTWASPDGPFASALADYQVTADGATYEAARQAYYVAYQLHIANQSAYAAQWTNYVNDLLNKASIEVSTLAM